jgi:hypothetical protein
MHHDVFCDVMMTTSNSSRLIPYGYCRGVGGYPAYPAATHTYSFVFLLQLLHHLRIRAFFKRKARFRKNYDV